jgi:outer membrane protein assembly factor BamD
MKRLVFLAAASLVLSGALTGCKTTEKAIVTEADQVADAQKNLKEGEEELESNNFPEAERLFSYVRNKYPYLEASKIAELRLADTEFKREKYAEARDRYYTFAKLHPTHDQVDYAVYQAAVSYVKEFPSDFFLFPPPHEKEQLAIRAALKAMNDFVRQYPKSKFVPEAQAHLKDIKTRLAKHEMYVAKFYRKRDRWPAVAGRLEGLLKNYPGSELELEAFWGLHEAYTSMNQPDKANDVLRRLIEKMPNTSDAERAKRLLPKS